MAHRGGRFIDDGDVGTNGAGHLAAGNEGGDDRTGELAVGGRPELRVSGVPSLGGTLAERGVGVVSARNLEARRERSTLSDALMSPTMDSLVG
jgi:hypothetical protein